MSRCLLRQLQNFWGLQTVPSAAALTLNFRQYANSSNDDGKSGLGQTTILVQQGCDIQELPVILRKLKKDEFESICPNANENEVDSRAITEGSNFKVEEVIAQLNNCMTSTGILSIIDRIPEAELCPEIASHALDRLIHYETLIGLRNLEDNSLVFEKLVDCIVKKGDHKTLLDFMEVLKTFLDLQKTVQRFCDELLMRNSDGILSIVEVCECIERFVDCKQLGAAEKFWSGIADNEKQIDDKNIKFIYKILPKVKVSRRLILGVLERRIVHVWWNLSSDAIAQIMTALAVCGCAPVRTMQSLSRCLNTNIHAMSETNLEAIVAAFTKLDFSNTQIEKAIERYVKAKGIKIRAQTLVVAILQHCVHFRIRNHHILNGCNEFFIANHSTVEPGLVKSFIAPYGYLDYQPLNGIKFWQELENYLKENFSQVSPRDLIEIFLNCCYLERYPLNFVGAVFNPYFLDLLHSTTSQEFITKVRSDLKLFDTTLSLECSSYAGPLLPRDHAAKSLWQDGRIKRIVNSITDQIEEIAGGPENFTKSAIYAKFPMNSLYIIDILIHPPGMGNLWSFSSRRDRNVYVAVLIQLPEYFNTTGEFLIGPQVMRIRHFRRLGMKVVTLSYDQLAKLRVHPKQLQKYLVESLREALPATVEK